MPRTPRTFALLVLVLSIQQRPKLQLIFRSRGGRRLLLRHPALVKVEQAHTRDAQEDPHDPQRRELCAKQGDGEQDDGGEFGCVGDVQREGGCGFHEVHLRYVQPAPTVWAGRGRKKKRKDAAMQESRTRAPAAPSQTSRRKAPRLTAAPAWPAASIFTALP